MYKFLYMCVLCVNNILWFKTGVADGVMVIFVIDGLGFKSFNPVCI